SRFLMPRFRPRSSTKTSWWHNGPLSPEMVRLLCESVMQPAHFFIGPNLQLDWEHKPSAQQRWEVFQGRLLDPAHTRQERTFEAWNIWQLTDAGRSGEPLLSLMWDDKSQQIHVVRGIESYVWEGYDSGGSVFQSREIRKWARELVGTIELRQMR